MKVFHLPFTISNTYEEDLRHLLLLADGAVVLYGQDDGVGGRDERTLVDRFHHRLKTQRTRC